MKKRYGLYILAILLGLMLFMPNKVSALFYRNGYVIEDYQINMIVNEDNTFDITEIITADFDQEKHGIIRKLPLKNTVIRTDGTTSHNSAKITNIEVSGKYKLSNKQGYKTIQIGDPNATVQGINTYTIRYKYDIGKDPLKNADELYFNLIGDQWDTTLQNVNFNITMPKSFDPSTLSFYTGKKGMTDNADVSYQINENTISGSLETGLTKEEGLTVRLTLPEGYFVGAGNHFDAFGTFVIILSIASISITFILWRKYGRDNTVVETVQFYPPEGYNSAEIGYLYNGNPDTQSVVSLLVYLANKGYLAIEEDKKYGFVASGKYKIIKLKEYDGDNEIEKIFFDGLFDCKSDIFNDIRKQEIVKKAQELYQKIVIEEDHSSREEGPKFVTQNDLHNKFYKTLNEIKKTIYKNYKDKVFESTASGMTIGILGMIIAIFLLITVKPVMDYGSSETLLYAVGIPAIAFAPFLSFVIGKSEGYGKGFAGGVVSVLFGILPWGYIIIPILKEVPSYIIPTVVGVIAIAILLVFAKIMRKRTAYGNELLGKLKGFRRFLEVAEKPELESLVEQNPEYFYDILPYTYALGVSDTWMKQFETIAIHEPNWYSSSSQFNVYSFGLFMNSTMTSASEAMSSRPSSSGGSGGGSSGGGSGGGGGSSW